MQFRAVDGVYFGLQLFALATLPVLTLTFILKKSGSSRVNPILPGIYSLLLCLLIARWHRVSQHNPLLRIRSHIVPTVSVYLEISLKIILIKINQPLHKSPWWPHASSHPLSSSERLHLGYPTRVECSGILARLLRMFPIVVADFKRLITFRFFASPGTSTENEFHGFLILKLIL